MSFVCNICNCREWDRTMTRGDGRRVLFCADCGMGSIENPPESTTEFYRDGYYGEGGDAKGYENYAFTAEHTQLWPQLMLEMLLPAGGRVLDVGCADGFFLDRLGPRFQRFGIEANPSAAARAAARGITILGHDIVELPPSTEKFDAVTAIATLEHVLDMRGAFMRCLDVLKPSGIMLLEVPLLSSVQDNRDWLQGSYEHISYPTISGMERLLGSVPGLYATGFETEIVGFSGSYIAVATRDPGVFRQALAGLDAMRQEIPDGLEGDLLRLNLAYQVVHSFKTSWQRMLAMPALFERVATPNLLKRLMQLWANDLYTKCR